MTCIDYDTLNQLKKLEKITFTRGNMSYFPDKDCNNPAHEEDNRPLDLPNLEIFSLFSLNLLKAPNPSLMPKLQKFKVPGSRITHMHGTPFANNEQLSVIGLTKNQLSVAPNLTGGCKNLDELNMQDNYITSSDVDYFQGCNIKQINLNRNKLTKFPNFAPLADSVNYIYVDSNEIFGTITNEMVKDLRNLVQLNIQENDLQGVDASFCQTSQPIEINVNQNPDLAYFENPYRFCTHLLDAFSIKPKMVLTSTQIPCDHHRCWMKKLASKFTIQADNCPDGRDWSALTETDVCGQGLFPQLIDSFFSG